MVDLFTYTLRKNTPFIIKTIVFFYVSLSYAPIFAQASYGTVDEVVSFIPGIGQNSGQSSEYFPNNIFGLPDSSARYSRPISNPDQICSLGLGGEITLRFHGKFLRDLPGIDFTIFENAFYSPDFNKIFVEPAVISVSKDGITFESFPFDSLSLKGCAGITPTNGENEAFDPITSGGDGFDLSVLGIDSIRFIRIHDVSSILLNPNHRLYDPIVTGFDLDAVVGVHLQNEIQPLPKVMFTDNSVFIRTSEDLILQCYSLEGKLIKKDIYSKESIDYKLDFLSSGVFALVLTATNHSFSSTSPFVICP